MSKSYPRKVRLRVFHPRQSTRVALPFLAQSHLFKFAIPAISSCTGALAPCIVRLSTHRFLHRFICPQNAAQPFLSLLLSSIPFSSSHATFQSLQTHSKMNLTLLTQLSAWPLIVPPDWAECELWFARPVRPQLSDCLVAFNRLPINEDAIKYRPITRDRTQPKGLLVMETHS